MGAGLKKGLMAGWLFKKSLFNSSQELIREKKKK